LDGVDGDLVVVTVKFFFLDDSVDDDVFSGQDFELAVGSELVDSKPASSELAVGELRSMDFMVRGPSRGRIVGVTWRFRWRGE
jgi:hypothetical protein